MDHLQNSKVVLAVIAPLLAAAVCEVLMRHDKVFMLCACETSVSLTVSGSSALALGFRPNAPLTIGLP